MYSFKRRSSSDGAEPSKTLDTPLAPGKSGPAFGTRKRKLPYAWINQHGLGSSAPRKEIPEKKENEDDKENDENFDPENETQGNL